MTRHVSEPLVASTRECFEAPARTRYTVRDRLDHLEIVVVAFAARVAELERLVADMRRQDQR